MTNNYASLITEKTGSTTPAPSVFLLGNDVAGGQVVPPDRVEQTDLRRSPYFRTEMLQKVTNLTTSRTHQYAVWVTVGLFEVVEPGDPSKLIPDKLGPEVGRAEGRNQRFRYFALIDRTKAIGFNPANPRHFGEIVPYFR